MWRGTRVAATRGDVLRTMDRFAAEVRFLMNVGPDKGPLIRELVAKLPADARILELGAFCGYSSILLATTLGPRGRIVSIEKGRAALEGARANVEYAGLSDRIQIMHGASTELIPTLEGCFDLVFLDHWKDLYLSDLELIEKRGLLRPGSIVVADNVGEVFGAAPYLEYVRAWSIVRRPSSTPRSRMRWRSPSTGREVVLPALPLKAGEAVRRRATRGLRIPRPRKRIQAGPDTQATEPFEVLGVASRFAFGLYEDHAR